MKLRCTGCNTEVPMTTNVEVDVDPCDPCWKCGATCRYMEMQQSVKFKTGPGRPALELSASLTMTTSTGRMAMIRRVIDREQDRYVECIRDADTGDLIREVREPLSRHQGAGHAKLPRPRDFG